MQGLKVFEYLALIPNCPIYDMSNSTIMMPLLLFIWHLVGKRDNGWKGMHYENTPILIYRKFQLQKLKIFR